MKWTKPSPGFELESQYLFLRYNNKTTHTHMYMISQNTTTSFPPRLGDIFRSPLPHRYGVLGQLYYIITHRKRCWTLSTRLAFSFWLFFDNSSTRNLLPLTYIDTHILRLHFHRVLQKNILFKLRTVMFKLQLVQFWKTIYFILFVTCWPVTAG